MIIPGPVLGFPLCLKSKCPCLFDWLIVCVMDRKKVAPFFLISYCGLQCSSVNWRQHFVCEWIMSVVHRLLCLFAFRQSPSGEGMTSKDDTGKRLVLASQPESWRKSALIGSCWLQIFIKMSSLPISNSWLERCVRVFRPSEASVPPLRNVTTSLKRGVVFRTAGIGITTAF